MSDEVKNGDFVRRRECEATHKPIDAFMAEIKADIRRVFERVNTLIMCVLGTGLTAVVLLIKGCNGGG